MDGLELIVQFIHVMEQALKIYKMFVMEEEVNVLTLIFAHVMKHGLVNSVKFLNVLE